MTVIYARLCGPSVADATGRPVTWGDIVTAAPTPAVPADPGLVVDTSYTIATVDGEEVWDFSLPDRPKKFKFNGDEVYEAPAVLPPAALQKMAKAAGQIGQLQDVDAKLAALTDVFSSVLVPESAARLRKRLEDEDYTEPVDLTRQLIPLLFALLEAYGLRPTQQSSPPAAGGATAPTATGSAGGAKKKPSTRKASRRTGG